MYLLSTQFLMDIACEDEAALAWINPVLEEGVAISVISAAAVRAAIEVADVAEGRRSLEARLRKFEALMRRTSGLLTFGEHEATVLGGILNLDLRIEDSGDMGDLDDMGRMVVATAIARGLVLVEREQPYHAGVLPELRTVDPYR